MSIAIDIRMLHHSGIGTYIRNLLNGLNALGKSRQFLLLSRSALIASEEIVGFRKFYAFDRGIYSVKEQLCYPRRISGVNLLHFPHYTFPLRFKGKLVLTIHDLNHLVFPEYLRSTSQRLFAKYICKKAVKRADAIIVGSQFVKKSLIDHVGADEKKINVVYYGIDDIFQRCEDQAKLRQFRRERNLPEDYVLSVGINKPHKNFARLIRVYAGLRSEGEIDVPLVIAGMGGAGKVDLIEQIVKLRAEKHVHFCDHLPFAQMPLLYSGARIFVFPSFYEGFGLPLAEAMACGVPIAASNAAAIPEVVKDAAILFDPHNEESMTEAVATLFHRDDLQEELATKGYTVAKQYNAHDMAAKTYEVYQKVL